MRTINSILIISLLISLAFNAYQYFTKPKESTKVLTNNTIKYLPSQATVDTVYKPSIKYLLKYKFDTLTSTVYQTHVDTVYPDVQVVHTTDSVYLDVKPSQKHYKYKNADVYVSGVNPSLDSLYIHQPSFHHGPSVSLNSVGYQFQYKRFSVTPYITFKGKPNISLTYYLK